DWEDEFDGAFIEVIQWIEACCGECDRLFRLPFHEAMTAFPLVEDIGLTGGIPHYNEAELRQVFNITAPPAKTALITFGGLGLDAVPYDGLRDRPDWQFITFDHQPPDDLPNLLKVTDRTYRPVDFMPLCGQIVSKPGYSTFSEACMVGVPVKTVEREGFAEAPILIEGIKRHAHHRILSLDELYAGTWEFLDQPCYPPTSEEPLAKDGNEAIAQAITEYFRNH
ncbi:MAG: glycosyl transferase, partial [Cyanothece sp. SIO2G6]|nr:glycosyl transferase [Cyanothece sp. SIO2G6]